jgi:GT2 family glycosyltransferase
MQSADDRLAVMGFVPCAILEPMAEQPPVLPPDWQSILPEFIHYNPCPPHCFLASRRLVADAGGFFEGFQAGGCEDWDLWLRLGLQGAGLVTVPRAGAFYRKHAAAMSGRHLRMLANRAEVLVRFQKQLALQPHLLSRWSGDVLQAALRIRYRCLANGVDRRIVAALSAAIRTLRELSGCSPPPLTRIVETLVGDWAATRLALAYLRVRDPRLYAYYTNPEDLR